MDEMIRRLASMSVNAAHNHLMTLDLPHELRIGLNAKANEYRRTVNSANRRAKLTQLHHDELWYHLIAPIKYELSNAKVGLRLKSFDAAPERHTAFSEYVALLEKLLAGLRKLQIDEGVKIRAETFEARHTSADDFPKTPAEIAADRGLPNKGAHWTDWISDKTKRRIESLFDAIPTRAKRPKPFAYRVPPDLFKRDIATFHKRTLKDLDAVEQELAMAKQVKEPNLDLIKSIAALEDKQKRIIAALTHSMRMENEPVPATWHGLDHLYDPDDYEDDWLAGWPVTHLRKLYEPKERATKKKTNRPRRYKK